MTTAILMMINLGGIHHLPSSNRQRVSAKILLSVSIALILIWLILTSTVYGYAGLGGYISETLLGQSGVSSSLYLGDSSDGPIVLGSVPTVSTTSVTNAVLLEGETSATLHGNLTSLNGMPRATVWFTWGDAHSPLSHTTAAVVVTSTGEFTADITGYDPGETIYWQAVASTDAVNTGEVQTFQVEGGQGLGYWVLWNILPIAIAAGIVVSVFLLTGNWLAMLVAVFVGIATIIVIRGILPVLW